MDEAPDSVAQALENAEIEAAIEACVRNFYAKGRNDDLLGPVFNSTVTDWERHLKRIQDFWSRTLLGTAAIRAIPIRRIFICRSSPRISRGGWRSSRRQRAKR